eukprot:GGOE01036425.1.p1 GENE.GGOE01036425.1~~GGOE01036425.1.p1  ORF type:complete len:360 (+),score=79.91 GGOE01036425.1:59-1138(+)
MKHEVALSGAVFGRLCHAFTTSHDAEGLLFGRTAKSTTVHKGDHDEAARISTVECTEVVAFHPLGPSLTFYNSAGAVRRDALPTHCPAGLQMVGWYRMRRNTSQRLSVREGAVLRDLGAVIPAPVFALFTERSGAEGATLSHHCSFHKVNPQTSLLCPVGCHIINLTSSSLQDYRQFSSWAPTGITAERLPSGEEADHILVAAAQRQTEAVEGYFRNQLTKLEGLAARVQISSEEVAMRERRLQQMRQKLVEQQRLHPVLPSQPKAEDPKPRLAATAPPRIISNAADIVALDLEVQLTVDGSTGAEAQQNRRTQNKPPSSGDTTDGRPSPLSAGLSPQDVELLHPAAPFSSAGDPAPDL